MRLKSPMPKLIPDLTLVLTRMNVAITRVLAGYMSRYSLCRMLQLMSETVSIVRRRCLSDFFCSHIEQFIFSSCYTSSRSRCHAVCSSKLPAASNARSRKILIFSEYFSIINDRMFSVRLGLTSTGRFIMFFVTTNIYNKKTKGPTLTLRLLMSYIWSTYS